MKVLVVGSGGREHALAWKLRQSPRVSELICAPGNGGMAGIATCVPVPAEDVRGLLALARERAVDFTVVGPEAPLSAGLVDLFAANGLRAFGASRAAAELEGSKAFAKDLMRRHGIPTAAASTFTDAAAARAHVRAAGAPLVVKADGLAAGKGVIICRTLAEAEQAVDEIMVRRAFGAAGDRVLVEEFLEGEEASFLAFTDGRTVVAMPASQDHKRVFDEDQGPNTGGMGAYSPAPVVTPAAADEVMRTVMVPTVRAMAAEGRPYRGVLYAGLMFTKAGIRVLEYNARFGDPEAQPVLMRMKGDLLPVLEACVDGRLDEVPVEWLEEAAVCVVLASGGYPGSYPKGLPIAGLEAAGCEEGVVVFHAGTALKEGRVVTAGGRVVGVTARGSGVRQAVERAYRAAGKISFDGMHYRRDIAQRALRREGK
ncbi:MAG TPA: phosphoribosylamine--glycine ligase [bacterium]